MLSVCCLAMPCIHLATFARGCCQALLCLAISYQVLSLSYFLDFPMFSSIVTLQGESLPMCCRWSFIFFGLSWIYSIYLWVSWIVTLQGNWAWAWAVDRYRMCRSFGVRVEIAWVRWLGWILFSILISFLFRFSLRFSTPSETEPDWLCYGIHCLDYYLVEFLFRYNYSYLDFLESINLLSRVPSYH
jgi:hypothetical protein